MGNNRSTQSLDALMAEYARRAAERRLRDELHARYRDLHRHAVLRRTASYILALALVVLTATAAMPPVEYDYITGNHAASPAVTLAVVRTTLAAL